MISSLITYLGTELSGDSYSEITNALNIDPVELKSGDLPALYIFPGEDSAQDENTGDTVSHLLRQDIYIHLACNIADYETLLTNLRTAVIGWSPGAGYDDMRLVSGSIKTLKGGVIWWEETYKTDIILRQVYS